MAYEVRGGDEMDTMAVFARVVEMESFSAAARALGLSKSAVSKRIKRLEDDLGVRLLNRTTRRLSVSEAGTAFYEGCQRVLAEAEATRAAVSHLAAAPRGQLRVNAPMSFGVRHLAGALAGFMGRYPELAVDLTLNDRFVDLVEEGFDVGIRIARLEASGLIARRLAPNRIILCAAPEYVRRHGAPRTVAELSSHDCLLYSYMAARCSWRFARGEEQAEVRVRGRLRINNGDAVLAAARAGQGIALLPSFICGDDLRAGRLTRVLPGWVQAGAPAVHAIYPARRNLSPKVRVFVDYMAACFGPAPYWDAGLDP